MSVTKAMSPKPPGRSHTHTRRTPEDPMMLACPTEVAIEALRTGILALHNHRRRDGIAREGEAIRAGDPDDGSLADEHVGEEPPRGGTPTPDQNSVDDIGRAYGVQEEDSGVLRISAEVLTRRDHHRMELQPTRKPA
jgi:Family of unknown function (DUF6335)